MSKDSDQKAIFEAAARWVARHDAGLSGPETEAFERWRAADARHEVAFERCSRAWAALDRPLLAGQQNALARELRARALRRQTRQRRVQMAAAAACAVVVLALATLWQRPSKIVKLPPPDAPTSSVVAATPAQPADDEQPRHSVVTVTSPEQRTLADGSTVDIKPGGVIDVRYDDTVRRVVLVSGEAHFQVMKGLPRPFVVVAGNIEVRAVGTAFAVGLEKEQTEVWVTEGRVAVEKPASQPDETEDEAISTASVPAAPAPESGATSERALVATLGIRERIVLKTAQSASAPVSTTVTPDEINQRLAWRVSRLEFSATPLAEAVALINSHSQMPDGSPSARLVLDESLSGMKTEPVSGYFPASDIATFVDLLNVSMGIESERRGNVIVLSKKE